MKGSTVQNIKFNPDKEKIVECQACHTSIVVGKFAKIGQVCDKCKNTPKGKASTNSSKQEPERQVRKLETPNPSFAKKLEEISTRLGFEIDSRRIWRKKYGIDNGGIVTTYIMVEPGVAGEKPRIDYFSVIIQRAVGINEDFRKFMPPDAASDCEVIASELGTIVSSKPQLGQEKCDSCGAMTDEFAVDNKRGRILCVRPNNCFKKNFTNAGAQAEA
jgi:hypothetical protein